MDVQRKAGLAVAPPLSALMLGDCGVSHSDEDALKAQNQALQGQNQQLRQQLTVEQTRVRRLQEAINYVIERDLLLLAPESWTIRESDEGIMADIAAKLAPASPTSFWWRAALTIRRSDPAFAPRASCPTRASRKRGGERHAVPHLAGRKSEH